MIGDAHNEDMKDALPALNARLVELADRVPDIMAAIGCSNASTPSSSELRVDRDQKHRRAS